MIGPDPIALGVPGVVQDLWAAAAARERFGAGDLLDQWLKHNDDAEPGLLQIATRTALDLQRAAKPALGPDGEPALRLSTEMRLQVLKDVGAEAVRRVLEAVPEAEITKAEKLFRSLLADGRPDYDAFDREDLVALSAAADSAGAAGAPLDFDPRDLRAEIRRLDLMLQLGGPDLHRFVGRDRELDRLRAYWQRPGLGTVVVEGPGGMGKSLLVCRFISEILDPSSSDAPQAVFHLDYDRRDLQDAGISSLVGEIIRQSLRWGPRDAVQRLIENLGRGVGQLETYAQSRSADHGYEGDVLLRELVPMLRGGSPEPCRIVLFMDSFEQVLGFNDAAAAAPPRLGAALRDAGADVLMIYGSRSLQTTWPAGWTGALRIKLGQFTADEAATYLRAETQRAGVTIDRPIVEQVVAAVGKSPLALRLAAAVIEKDGGKFDPSQWASKLRDDPERLQAALYDRMLKRIRDPNLRKIALPGLLVRRLTEGVISEVLAGPCDLNLALSPARELMAKGGHEGQLFVRDASDLDPGALWHRQDVRALMLPDLDAKVPEPVARQINEHAVAYYSPRDDDVSRAEELYHRLRLGQGEAQVGPRWTAGAGQRLRSALGELPPAGRSTARRLFGTSSLEGVRLQEAEDANLAAHAPPQPPQQPLDKDSLAELRGVVQRELQSATAGADPFAILARFGADTLQGPLGDLYAEALVASGRIGELIEGIGRGLRGQTPPAVYAAILSSAGGALEGMGRPWDAARYWRAAVEALPVLKDDDIYVALAARVGQARTLRKVSQDESAPAFSILRSEVLSEIMTLVAHVQHDLGRHRVLCREVVAEASDALVGSPIDPQGILLSLLSNLLETGEAFPGAIGDPARAGVIGEALLGFPVQSLRELGGAARKLVYGSVDDLQKLIDTLRGEVEWTLARAVSRPTTWLGVPPPA